MYLQYHTMLHTIILHFKNKKPWQIRSHITLRKILIFISFNAMISEPVIHVKLSTLWRSMSEKKQTQDTAMIWVTSACCSGLHKWQIHKIKRHTHNELNWAITMSNKAISKWQWNGDFPVVNKILSKGWANKKQSQRKKFRISAMVARIWVMGCWCGYVCVKVQICIWPSRCHCHSPYLAAVNPDCLQWFDAVGKACGL